MSPEESKDRYLSHARQSLETFIKYGTDRYGVIHSPIWVTTLDLETLDCPRVIPGDILRQTKLERLAAGYSMYSTSVPIGNGIRAGRISQQGRYVSNLLFDQHLIRAADALSRATGEQDYTKAAQAYASYYLQHFVDNQTGLIYWGWHDSYDPFDDGIVFPEAHFHELGIFVPQWPLLHQAAPEVIEREIEKIWEWHVNHQNGQIGRHNEHGRGCSFIWCAGEFVLAFAWLHHLRGGMGPWLDRALLVARRHWEFRNPQTNLVPNRTPEPDEGRDTQRFDFLCSDTSVPGLWATRLLMAWRMSGCEELRNMACAELKAWARYGWDVSTQQPWGLLELDGRAVSGPRAESGTYDKYAPRGHLNLWTNYMNDYEHPGPYALSYLAAYHATDDLEFLAIAEQFAACYAQGLPANGGHGTYAHHYGQLISLAVGLAVLKGESKYLALARQVANEAIDKLWSNSLFAGYPNHGYYEAIHGVGYLLLGLVELSQAEKGTKLSWQNDPFAWNL